MSNHTEEYDEILESLARKGKEDLIDAVTASEYEEDDIEEEEVTEDEDDVELLEVDDGEIVEEEVSDSDFESLPPPIHIPDALRPVHMRGDPSWDVEDRNAAKKKKKSMYDDSSSDDDDDDDDDDTDTSLSRSETKPKTPPTTGKALTLVKENRPTPDDDDDSDDSSEADESLAEEKGRRKGANGKIVAARGENTAKSNSIEAKEANTESVEAKPITEATENSKGGDGEAVEKKQDGSPSTKPSENDEIKKNDVSIPDEKSGGNVEKEAEKEQDDPSTSRMVRIPVRSDRLRGTSFDEDNHDETNQESPPRGGKKPEKDEKTPLDSNGSNQQNEEKKTPGRTISQIARKEAAEESNQQNEEKKIPGRTISQIARKEAAEEKDPTHEKYKGPVWHPPSKDEGKEEEDEEKGTDNDDGSVDEDDPNGEYYTVKELRKKSVPGLDYLNREKYLRGADFKAAFGCKREVFYSWPKWKQTKAKRAAKLF